MSPEDHEAFIRNALEQMIAGRMTPGEEGIQMLSEIRDSLAAHLGVSPEENRFLQAHQAWLHSKIDMDSELWDDFMMSEPGFYTLTMQVEESVQGDKVLPSLPHTPEGLTKAWVMGYLIGMLAERGTRKVMEERDA